ncbi:hypothetical protein [Beijerinckia indica]|uniref:Uncharacterized protein n=1 Tax=Beijerinckia indica subsp. indica (strain ATCC 9039 / DSM 1715 / NCIMB 8712) TaxID=395963 RepID=B2IBH0_BEII9|nr:hypothetical protein [Beijerinckia indica]ACB96596.1 hypothetical protein Bind_3034 [Beijerinckia indica subsp. indica ATCC 9039]
MNIANMIPTLDDVGLANLRRNALRLESGDAGARQIEAACLLPLIDAEIERRSKSVKATPQLKKALVPKGKRKAYTI